MTPTDQETEVAPRERCFLCKGADEDQDFDYCRACGRGRAAHRRTWAMVPRAPGSCELDDSGWLLAFMLGLHFGPGGPQGWSDFSDAQRERIKAAYRAMLSAAPTPPAPSLPAGAADPVAGLPERLAGSMDGGKAHQILSQSLAGTATEMCRFEEDGRIFIRRDGVIKAMRNTASWVAEEVAGFGGVFPGWDLVRSLDLGEATAPEQLRAAMALRLLHAPGSDFKGLRITLQVDEGGHVSTHTQGFNTLGHLVEGLLEAALKSLSAEVSDFKRCPFHSATSPSAASAGNPATDHVDLSPTTAGSAEGVKLDREQVARIIDPPAFDTKRYAPTLEKYHARWMANKDRRAHAALAKADAILALASPAPTQTGEGQ